MAFIFSTSHLPETRVRRPDHLEDEEEDDDMQPMPRAGGVRAFSHLPQPVRAQADFSDPLSTRPATPVGRPRPHTEPDDDQDTGRPPEPYPDPEDDTAPQDHADDRPWYMPRITAQDLPPQDHHEDAHAPVPNPWENTTRSSRFDDTPPADRSTSSSGFFPSPQDLRDAFHSPTPDSPTGEAAAQDSTPPLPRGRFFEKRLPPGLRGQSAGQFQSLAAKAPKSSPEDFRSHLANYAQSVTDTRGAAPPQPQGRNPATPTTGSSPEVPGAASPAQAPASIPTQAAPSASQPTVPGSTINVPKPLTIHPADEASVDARGRKFGDTVRSIMRAELAGSPTAAALLKRAIELSGKQVVIKMIPYDPKRKDQKEQEAFSETGPDGTIIVHINPATLKSGTLSHEISHGIQG
ncbi:MAG: hypothetical protein B7Z37_23135 [Verrucomicrobia bacterium 12-59-8]|nr:MAG: hypothetical protein B7Z37_23135 [Verrucomicrobia bacterium 12-59-8]